MKPRDRGKHKGRRDSGTFVRLPHDVMDSPNWRACSGTAIKLLCDLARQFNGRNNGDLGASMTALKPRGWSSSETIGNALRELRYYRLIRLTRQGGLHGASLYALTWIPINDCGGKLDCSATTTPPGDWKEPHSASFKRPKRTRKQNATPESDTARIGIRSDGVKKAA